MHNLAEEFTAVIKTTQNITFYRCKRSAINKTVLT